MREHSIQVSVSTVMNNTHTEQEEETTVNTQEQQDN
jgi:hypothetical protein